MAQHFFQTISLLKSLTPAEGDIAFVRNYDTIGDGGGGEFYWDASSAEVDNRGTVFKTASPTGRWKRNFSGTLNVRWFGAKDNVDTPQASGAVQAALYFATKNRMKLFFPAGTYLQNYQSDFTSQTEKRWGDFAHGPGDIFDIEGELGTILKVSNNAEIGPIGSFNCMFALQGGNIKEISIKNMTLDMNATVHNLPPGGGPNNYNYNWQQVHMLFIEGSASSNPIEKVNCENLTLKDKIGGGIVLASQQSVPGYFKHVTIRNVNTPNETAFLGGLRGEIEFNCFVEDLVVDNVYVPYLQCEAETAGVAGEVYTCTITNSSFYPDFFFKNYLPGSGLQRIVLNNFRHYRAELPGPGGLFRGIHLLADNCVLKLSQEVEMKDLEKGSRIANCEILTNVVGNTHQGIYISPTVGFTSEITFDGCRISPISVPNPQTTTGWAFVSVWGATEEKINVVVFRNCVIERYENGISAYHNGTVTIDNCRIDVRTYCIQGGAYASFYSNLTVKDCWLSGTNHIYLQNINENWHLTVLGEYDGLLNVTVSNDWVTSGTRCKFLCTEYNNSFPVYGLKGQKIIDNIGLAELGGGYVGWICVKSGNPATWKQFCNVSS